MSTPLEDFFNSFEGFRYNSAREAHLEFQRLCREYGWDKGNEERQAATLAFQQLLIHLFGEIYGTDVNDLAAWHRLCVALGMNPLPEDLSEAKKAVKSTHVNLIDLTLTMIEQRQVPVVPSEHALSVYTKPPNLPWKIFHREAVRNHGGQLLRRPDKPLVLRL